MKAGFLAKHFQYSLIALALVSFSTRALAQHAHTQPTAIQNESADRNNKSALIKIVRQATERFKDVSVAQREGYSLLFGCVTGPDAGAMGLHFVNASILGSGVIDATRPQIVIYEPSGDGKLRLIGADYLVFADAWDATHTDPPQLMGQLFHLFDSPNRFKLPAFYTLHVWAWKESPTGPFVNWHANVSCRAYNGQLR